MTIQVRKDDSTMADGITLTKDGVQIPVLAGGSVFDGDDFQVKSTGNDNMLFVDYSADVVGIGTSTPSQALEVEGIARFTRTGVSGVTSSSQYYQPDTTDGNGLVLTFNTDTTGAGASSSVALAQVLCQFDTHNHATRAGSLHLRTSQGGGQVTRLRADAGIRIGSVASDPGAGALETENDITAGGSIFANGETGPRMQMKTLTVANGATAQLPHVSGAGIGTTGFLFISRNTACAIFILRGGNDLTQEVADPDNVFSATAGTGSSTNIYWSAGNNRYEIQNNSGDSITYRMWFMVY